MSIGIALVELIEYEKWITSLGYDREWKVQSFQHEIYSKLYKLIGEVNSFLIPLTFHNMAFITNGLKEQDILNIFEKIKEEFKFKLNLRMYCCSERKLVLALNKASHLIKNLKPDECKIEELGKGYIVSSHLDLNSFLLILDNYKAYQTIQKTYLYASSLAEKVGGIAIYLGGDNVVLFSDEEILKVLQTMKNDEIKIGVGVASNARTSLKLAAKALDKIRKERINSFLVLYED